MNDPKVHLVKFCYNNFTTTLKKKSTLTKAYFFKNKNRQSKTNNCQNRNKIPDLKIMSLKD